MPREREYAAKRLTDWPEDEVLNELRFLRGFSRSTGTLSKTGKQRLSLLEAEVKSRGLEYRKECPACGGSGWVKS